MTTSQVKVGLDSIASNLASMQGVVSGIQAQLQEVSTNLSAIPANNSEVIAAIQAYTPTGASETLAKDELAKLTTEFQALKAAVDAAAAAI